MIRPLTSFSLSLDEAAILLSAEKKNYTSVEFTGATHNDAFVLPGDIFLAFPGAKSHGAAFIESAKSKGAVAVLTDEEGAKISASLPTLVVRDAREAGAILASHLYREPSRSMQSIGITGTNGKTTVTTLLYQIFSAVGRETGLIGTVETRIGTERIKSDRTTPEASELAALAASMVEQHMRHLVMEVSSHSLSLKRLTGTHFSIVGFTNLSQDHLDFHGDMERYFAAKSELFTHEYADLGFVNIDNSYGLQLFEHAPIPVISLSRTLKSATWHFTEIHRTNNGFEFTMRGRDGILIESSCKIFGDYNLDNLLMAVAIAYECGIDPLELASIIPSLTGAPGRLESVSLGQNFTALVDYAHSPDAVENVLSAVREFTSGRVIAVLGCGGNRDATKRPLMGKALAQASDVAIFTSDNPRNEDPAAILSQMTAGISLSPSCIIVEDRSAAIIHAVALAAAGDTVVVLGKGHEIGQEISGRITPFDDRIELARAIEGKK